MMGKQLIVLFWMVFAVFPSVAQLDPYNYRVGLGVGYSNYYGDLSPYRIRGFQNLTRLYEYNPHFIPGRSYALSFEKRLSNSLGLMIQGGSYQFSMSDRYLNREGVLQTQLPNFNRALNFKTKVKDVGLALMFRTDNDRLLNQNAFIAPYLTLGVGISLFDAYGDLLDDEGQPYDYGDPSERTNDLFETPLREVRTELDQAYGRYAWYYGLGLGIRFKITKQIEFFVQSDFRYSSSDYLDDVSGLYRNSYENEFQQYAALPGTNFPDNDSPYRGDPNGKNDWYILHQAGLRISFKPSKQAFKASRISPSRSMIQAGSARTGMTTARPASNSGQETLPAENGEQFFNFFQINTSQANDEKLQQKVAFLDQKIAVLEVRQQLASHEYDLVTLTYQLDSINTLGSDLLSKTNPTRTELIKLAEVQQVQQDLTDRYANARTRRNQTLAELEQAEYKLDSVQTAAANAYFGRADQLDTLVFISGFREFSEKIALSLDQPDNWLLLQPSNENSRSMGAPRGIPPSNERVLSSTDYDEAQLGYQPYSTVVPLERPVYVYPEEVTPEIQERDKTRVRQRTETTDSETLQPTGPITPDPNSASPDKAIQEAATSNLPPAIIPIPAGTNESDPEPKGENQSEVEQQPSEAKDPGPQTSQVNPSESWKVERDTIVIDKKVIVGFPVSKKEVFFASNRSDLDEQELRKLNEVADLLKNQDDYFITLTGFTDNTGSISHNLSLAERRVSYVKEHFVKQEGIDPDRIITKPSGLLVRDSKGGSRQEDRKVEILIEVTID